MAKVASNITELIGRTPLLELSKIEAERVIDGRLNDYAVARIGENIDSHTDTLHHTRHKRQPVALNGPLVVVLYPAPMSII